ncbi:hypothetical protein [Pseudomonas sp.]|nr:hypothetical protein [Pseudomonas sp.]
MSAIPSSGVRMDSLKDLMDLLGKAKNLRLNIAAFVVSSIVLFGVSKELFSVGDAFETVLKGLALITAIRIVYGVIGFILDSISRLQNRKAAALAKELLDEEARIRRELDIKNAADEKLKKENKIRHAFENLDIFQLYYIQELRKQNHINISKGADLFSLKGSEIVRAVSTNERMESVALTREANLILNGELWARFDELKRNSVTRFFEGVQPMAMKYFKDFLTEDKINTRNIHARSLSYYENEGVFSKFSRSVVFLQPQTSSIYTIDPIAKSALAEVINKGN